jgi:hypothetical protein
VRLGRVALFTLLTLLLLGESACASRGAPLELRAERSDVQADGFGVAAPLVYRVGELSRVSLYAIAPNGQRYPLRTGEPRSPGEYRYSFDGTYPLSDDPDARRVLPDGAYRIVLEADNGSGSVQRAETTISVSGADTTPPAFENLAVYPPVVTPNFDGRDDAVAITYRLSKRSRVIGYVLDGQGRRFVSSRLEVREPGEQRDVWDGTNGDEPLPDGQYQVVLRAADAAGNVTLAHAPVVVAASGRPEARILRASFTPHQLAVGDIVTAQITVKNTGATVIRTQGPDPGFLYSSYDTFSSVLDRRFVDRAGLWRVGVDWAGSPGGSASKYPYRWGFGHDLQPGEEVTIEGKIRFEHGPLQDRGVGTPSNRIYLYAGLIQENLAFFDDKVGGAWIELGY